MFTKKFNNTISSDQGFEIQIKSRGKLSFKQGKKTISIGTELLANDYIIAIWKDSIIRWDSPFENEILSAEEANKILENIRAALDFAKVKYEVY